MLEPEFIQDAIFDYIIFWKNQFMAIKDSFFCVVYYQTIESKESDWSVDNKKLHWNIVKLVGIPKKNLESEKIKLIICFEQINIIVFFKTKIRQLYFI